MHETSRDLMELLMLGRLGPFFWLFVVGGILVPIVLIALPQTSNVTGRTAARPRAGRERRRKFPGVIPARRPPSSRRSGDGTPEARPAAGCRRGRPRLPGRGSRDGRWSRQSGNAGAGAAAAGAAR